MNFTHAVFSILELLPLEDRTNSLSRNIGKNYQSKLRNISEEQRSHMTIWRCRLGLDSARSGSERPGLAQSGPVLETRS
jgi:hypothetical protein